MGLKSIKKKTFVGPFSMTCDIIYVVLNINSMSNDPGTKARSCFAYLFHLLKKVERVG